MLPRGAPCLAIAGEPAHGPAVLEECDIRTAGAILARRRVARGDLRKVADATEALARRWLAV